MVVHGHSLGRSLPNPLNLWPRLSSGSMNPLMARIQGFLVNCSQDTWFYEICLTF